MGWVAALSLHSAPPSSRCRSSTFEDSAMEDHTRPLPFVPTESLDRGAGIQLQLIQFDASGIRTPFKAARFVIQPGHSSREDVHAVAETWVIAAGQGRLFHDAADFKVTAGDAVYFAPHKKHRIVNDG